MGPLELELIRQEEAIVRQQAQENLSLLEIDKLKITAYKEHITKNYDKARKIYLQILEIEPEDEWTLTNLKELP